MPALFSHPAILYSGKLASDIAPPTWAEIAPLIRDEIASIASPISQLFRLALLGSKTSKLSLDFVELFFQILLTTTASPVSHLLRVLHWLEHIVLLSYSDKTCATSISNLFLTSSQTSLSPSSQVTLPFPAFSAIYEESSQHFKELSTCFDHNQLLCSEQNTFSLLFAHYSIPQQDRVNVILLLQYITAFYASPVYSKWVLSAQAYLQKTHYYIFSQLMQYNPRFILPSSTADDAPTTQLREMTTALLAASNEFTPIIAMITSLYAYYELSFASGQFFLASHVLALGLRLLYDFLQNALTLDKQQFLTASEHVNDSTKLKSQTVSVGSPLWCLLTCWNDLFLVKQIDLKFILEQLLSPELLYATIHHDSHIALLGSNSTTSGTANSMIVPFSASRLAHFVMTYASPYPTQGLNGTSSPFSSPHTGASSASVSSLLESLSPALPRHFCLPKTSHPNALIALLIPPPCFDPRTIIAPLLQILSPLSFTSYSSLLPVKPWEDRQSLPNGLPAPTLQAGLEPIFFTGRTMPPASASQLGSKLSFSSACPFLVTPQQYGLDPNLGASLETLHLTAGQLWNDLTRHVFRAPLQHDLAALYARIYCLGLVVPSLKHGLEIWLARRHSFHAAHVYLHQTPPSQAKPTQQRSKQLVLTTQNPQVQFPASQKVPTSVNFVTTPLHPLVNEFVPTGHLVDPTTTPPQSSLFATTKSSNSGVITERMAYKNTTFASAIIESTLFIVSPLLLNIIGTTYALLTLNDPIVLSSDRSARTSGRAHVAHAHDDVILPLHHYLHDSQGPHSTQQLLEHFTAPLSQRISFPSKFRQFLERLVLERQTSAHSTSNKNSVSATTSGASSVSSPSTTFAAAITSLAISNDTIIDYLYNSSETPHQLLNIAANANCPEYITLEHEIIQVLEQRHTAHELLSIVPNLDPRVMLYWYGCCAPKRQRTVTFAAEIIGSFVPVEPIPNSFQMSSDSTMCDPLLNAELFAPRNPILALFFPLLGLQFYDMENLPHDGTLSATFSPAKTCVQAVVTTPHLSLLHHSFLLRIMCQSYVSEHSDVAFSSQLATKSLAVIRRKFAQWFFATQLPLVQLPTSTTTLEDLLQLSSTSSRLVPAINHVYSSTHNAASLLHISNGISPHEIAWGLLISAFCQQTLPQFQQSAIIYRSQISYQAAFRRNFLPFTQSTTITALPKHLLTFDIQQGLWPLTAVGSFPQSIQHQLINVIRSASVLQQDDDSNTGSGAGKDVTSDQMLVAVNQGKIDQLEPYSAIDTRGLHASFQNVKISTIFGLNGVSPDNNHLFGASGLNPSEIASGYLHRPLIEQAFQAGYTVGKSTSQTNQDSTAAAAATCYSFTPPLAHTMKIAPSLTATSVINLTTISNNLVRLPQLAFQFRSVNSSVFDADGFSTPQGLFDVYSLPFRDDPPGVQEVATPPPTNSRFGAMAAADSAKRSKITAPVLDVETPLIHYVKPAHLFVFELAGYLSRFPYLVQLLDLLSTSTSISAPESTQTIASLLQTAGFVGSTLLPQLSLFPLLVSFTPDSLCHILPEQSIEASRFEPTASQCNLFFNYPALFHAFQMATTGNARNNLYLTLEKTAHHVKLLQSCTPALLWLDLVQQRIILNQSMTATRLSTSQLHDILGFDPNLRQQTAAMINSHLETLLGSHSLVGRLDAGAVSQVAPRVDSTIAMQDTAENKEEEQSQQQQHSSDVVPPAPPNPLSVWLAKRPVARLFPASSAAATTTLQPPTLPPPQQPCNVNSPCEWNLSIGSIAPSQLTRNPTASSPSSSIIPSIMSYSQQDITRVFQQNVVRLPETNALVPVQDKTPVAPHSLQISSSLRLQVLSITTKQQLASVSLELASKSTQLQRLMTDHFGSLYIPYVTRACRLLATMIQEHFRTKPRTHISVAIARFNHIVGAIEERYAATNPLFKKIVAIKFQASQFIPASHSRWIKCLAIAYASIIKTKFPVLPQTILCKF